MRFFKNLVGATLDAPAGFAMEILKASIKGKMDALLRRKVRCDSCGFQGTGRDFYVEGAKNLADAITCPQCGLWPSASKP